MESASVHRGHLGVILEVTQGFAQQGRLTVSFFWYYRRISKRRSGRNIWMTSSRPRQGLAAEVRRQRPGRSALAIFCSIGQVLVTLRPYPKNRACRGRAEVESVYRCGCELFYFVIYIILYMKSLFECHIKKK